MGIKMKLCGVIHNICHYKNIVFYCRCLSTLVAMATLNFPRLIMGKLNIGIYCYFIADILTIFLEMFVEWSSTKHILFVQTSQFDWLS